MEPHHFLFVTAKMLLGARAGSPVPEQNVAEKLQIEPLRAAVRHIGSRPASVANGSSQQTPDAEPDRKIQKDDRVSARKAEVQSASVVSFDKPAIGGDDGLDPGSQLAPVGFYPPRQPAQLVQVVNRKAEPLLKLIRES